MVLREFQILTETLWESIKTDLNFFAPISKLVKDLSEFNLEKLSKESLNELGIYVNAIEQFFDKYRSKGYTDVIYFPPAGISKNDDTVIRIHTIFQNLKSMSDVQLATELKVLKPIKPFEKKNSSNKAIFVGHGRSRLWARLELFIKTELNLSTFNYESESHTSETIINVLDNFLNKSSFAILVFTAEDETLEGKYRARQNVIHEAGLFQGRLGFDKVVILKQTKIEDFSNIAGLQYISFTDENIEQTFYELQRVLKKHGFIN